jgi:hypothetical protein
MSLIANKCIEYDENRPICVASQNGKVYTLNNGSNYKIKKVAVDKCILQNIGEKRCDYLMHASNAKGQKVFFIELKGGAFLDALEQIYDTLIYLNGEFKGHVLNARIVGKGDTPDLTNSAIYKKLFRKISFTKGTIKRATNKLLIENI